MTAFEMIVAESTGERRSLVLAAGVAGLCNILLVALANAVASGTWTQAGSAWALFGLGIVVYAISARRTYHRSVVSLEAAMLRVKNRLIAKIGRTELAELERIGNAAIYDRLTASTAVVSHMAGMTAVLLQSLGVLHPRPRPLATPPATTPPAADTTRRGVSTGRRGARTTWPQEIRRGTT